MPILRSFAARGALVLVSVLLTFVAAEAVLRLAGFDPSYSNVFRSFHEPHPLVGLRGRPQVEGRFRTAEIDAWVANGTDGYRLPQAPRDLDSAARRIVVLGDSFAWGWGVGQGEHFSDQLSEQRPEWYVRNLAVSATGPLQQLRILEEDGAHLLRSGDVVLSLFFWNDFSDNVDGRDGSMLHARLDDRGELRIYEPDPGSPFSFKQWLRQRSIAVNLVLFQLNRLSPHRAVGASSPRHIPGSAGDADVLAMRHALASLRDVAAARGAHFVLAIIPAPTELGLVPTDPGDPENLQFLRRSLQEITVELDLEVIDLLPIFRAAQRREARHGDGRSGEGFYFPLDRHWTAAGHALAARAVAEALGENLARGALAAETSHQEVRSPDSKPSTKIRAGGPTRKSSRHSD